MGLAELFLGSSNPIAKYVAANHGAIRGIGQGLAMGPTFGQGLAQAAYYAGQGAQADDVNNQRISEEQKRQDQIAKEIDYLRSANPKLAELVSAGMDPNAAFGVLLDQFKPKAPPEGFTLGEGQVRYGPNGEVIASGPSKPSAAATAPTGYQFKPDGTLSFIPGGPADPSTAGKTTEATRRNQQLATVIDPEVKSLIGDGTPQNPGTFDSLANGGDQARNAGGGIAMALGQGPSAEYQQAQNSLKTIIASYLYSVSGATANPGEVETQAAILTPKIGEDPKSIAAKKDRVVQMVEAVRAAATGKQINIDSPSAPSANDPLGIR